MAPGPDWGTTYPILRTKTYLASHSLGAVPAATADRLRRYWDEWATLGASAWEGPWWDSVVEFQREVGALLGTGKDAVAPLPNATRAMAAVASALDFSGPRRKVVMTDLEFTTFYPFWRGQERAGAELVVVPSDGGLTVAPEKIAAEVDERTLLVATCHVYFRSGAVQDVAAVTEAAHRKGALALVDGYQAVGALPVDVEEIGADFYVGGSHKYLCGGPGAGYLYVRPDLVGALRPRTTGWFGLEDPFAFLQETGSPPLHRGVLRFLDGTPNIPGLYAALEGIKRVREQGAVSIRTLGLRRTKAIMDRADELGLEVNTPREDAERGGMVCLGFPGAEDAVEPLLAHGVVVDHRPACGLRVSPHFYNADADVERFFAALAEVRARPRKAPRTA